MKIKVFPIIDNQPQIVGILRPIIDQEEVGIFLFSLDGFIYAMNEVCESLYKIPQKIIYN